MAIVLEPPTSSGSAEVEDVAQRHQVLNDLPRLKEAVAQLLPNASIHVELQIDPEINGLAWIVFVAQGTHLDGDAMTATSKQWRTVLFTICADPDARSCFCLQIWD